MKNHRKWEVILAYFKEIPINQHLLDGINTLLKEGNNILIMIQKENPDTNPQFKPEEKFKALCEIFPEETKTGKIIISKVPEINQIHKSEL